MRPIRRILVAVKDPGARSLPAVAKAAWLARACGAHLEIFHSVKASVFANTLTAYEEALLDLHDTQRRHYLQRLGRIAIVVMGALSRSGLKRLIIGNTAEGLLDELPCDLLIVKPAQFASRVTGTCKGPRLVAKAG